MPVRIETGTNQGTFHSGPAIFCTWSNRHRDIKSSITFPSAAIREGQIEIFQLGTFDLLIFGAVTLAAGIVRGYSGFGFSAVIMGGLAFILPPAEIVPIAFCLEIIASLLQAKSIWKHINWSRLGILLATAAIGNPIGIWVLGWAEPELLSLTTYLIIGLASTFLLFWHRKAIRESTGLWVFTGLTAAVVNGATALSGMVLVVIMTLAAVPAAGLRATLIAYFFASDALAILVMSAGNFIDLQILERVALAAPIMAVGVFAGSQRFAGATPEEFRKFTLFLLCLISLTGVLRFWPN